MEYRQYQNLSETYLNQVNEDTKQNLDEVALPVNLALLAARAAQMSPKLSKILKGLGGLELAAYGSAAADEFEGEDTPQKPGDDYDGDGIRNSLDSDDDNDGILDVDDDNQYGGIGSQQAGKREIGGVPNPLSPVIRASEKIFVDYPTDAIEYLVNLFSEDFENKEKEHLNEIALPALIPILAPLAAKLGITGTTLTAAGLAAGTAMGGSDRILSKSQKKADEQRQENIDAVNAKVFGSGQLQDVETINSVLDLIGGTEGVNVAVLDSPYDTLVGITTVEDLYNWLTNNGITITGLYDYLLQMVGAEGGPNLVLRAEQDALDFIRSNPGLFDDLP